LYRLQVVDPEKISGQGFAQKKKVIFFNKSLLTISDVWLAEGSPPSLLLTQDPEASVSGFFFLWEYWSGS